MILSISTCLESLWSTPDSKIWKELNIKTTTWILLLQWLSEGNQQWTVADLAECSALATTIHLTTQLSSRKRTPWTTLLAKSTKRICLAICTERGLCKLQRGGITLPRTTRTRGSLKLISSLTPLTQQICNLIQGATKCNRLAIISRRSAKFTRHREGR